MPYWIANGGSDGQLNSAISTTPYAVCLFLCLCVTSNLINHTQVVRNKANAPTTAGTTRLVTATCPANSDLPGRHAPDGNGRLPTTPLRSTPVTDVVRGTWRTAPTRARRRGVPPRAGRAGQPPWPALPSGPTFTGESGPFETGSVPAPGQLRVTDFVSSGGVTTSPVTRTPEPPDVLIG